MRLTRWPLISALYVNVVQVLPYALCLMPYALYSPNLPFYIAIYCARDVTSTSQYVWSLVKMSAHTKFKVSLKCVGVRWGYAP